MHEMRLLRSCTGIFSLFLDNLQDMYIVGISPHLGARIENLYQTLFLLLKQRFFHHNLWWARDQPKFYQGLFFSMLIDALVQLFELFIGEPYNGSQSVHQIRIVAGAQSVGATIRVEDPPTQIVTQPIVVQSIVAHSVVAHPFMFIKEEKILGRLLRFALPIFLVYRERMHMIY